jgi:hypothetical protein
MSLIPFQWKNCRGLVAHCAPIVCIVTVTILLGRGLPVGLLHGAHSRASHSFANHSHRPCFDHNDFQWSTSSPIMLGDPPVAAEPNQLVAGMHSVGIVIDSWHCDRPPPAS